MASRLRDRFHRPAVVIGFDGDDGKGSGRSVTGVDLGAAVQRLVAEGLLEKGGGHKMAAGLSVARGQLDKAMARLEALLAKQGAGVGGVADLRIDGLLMPGAATVDLIETIEAAGPFGASAPAPRWAMPDMRINHARRVGENHLKLSVSDGIGPTLDTITFGAFDGPLGPALEAHCGPAIPPGRTAGGQSLAGPRTCADAPGGRSPGGVIGSGSPPAEPVQIDRRIRLPLTVAIPKTPATKSARGPFVYRLGRQVFNLERGVRFPYGLPNPLIYLFSLIYWA